MYASCLNSRPHASLIADVQQLRLRERDNIKREGIEIFDGIFVGGRIAAMNHEALSNRGMLQGVASSPTTLTYSRRNLRHPECNTTSSVLLYRLAQIPVFTDSRG